jgi:3-phosphoshikimate 1-carboxyvinyltransferase
MKDGAGETVTITGPPRSTAQFSASQHAELQPDRLSDSRPVKPNNRLTGIDIDLNSAPDALPILAVTACFAAGTTRLLNVPQARIKETDRIAVMAAELKRLGADITELEDGLIITGTGRLSGGTVQGHADHRVIMALAVASLAADGPMEILGTDAVDVTFPDFFLLLEAIREKG